MQPIIDLFISNRLTGERRETLKRVIVIDLGVGLGLAAINVVLILLGYGAWLAMPTFLLVMLLFVYRLVKKQTYWQLSRQEVAEGQASAREILKGLNVKITK